MVSDRISFGGLASGIDTNSIINQLMRVQRRPILLAENRLAQTQQRRDALGQVSQFLGRLADASKALQDPMALRARSVRTTAKTEDANKVTAQVKPGTAFTSFTVDVISLATATRVAGASALGLAVDRSASLAESGSSIPVTAGTFSINGHVFTIDGARASSVTSAGAVGAATGAATQLQDAGLDTPLAATGQFEVNGTTIAYDASVDTLSAVLTRINASEAGVTASFDATTRELRLTANETGAGAIALADLDGNFLEAMRLVDGGGNVVGVQVAGAAMMSLDDAVAMINAAGIGVTAAVVADPDGRDNLLQLTSAGPIQLGSGADSSNFLAAMRLLQSPGGSTRTSVRGIAGADAGSNLGEARFATPLTQPAGSFVVNGVTIEYRDSDSLTNVMTRINGSGAGVTASYDAVNDRLRLTANTFGSIAIQLEDVDGNFLAAAGVLGASQTEGANASYRIDGGALQYATSNTVADVVPGVTLSFTNTTTEAVTIEVVRDTNTITKQMTAFVEQYNAATGLIRELTKYKDDGPNGILFGDSGVRAIERTLRSMVTAPATGVESGPRTMAEIGLSFGAFGAAVGTTNNLVFDQARFEQALADDPEAVIRLMTAFELAAGLEAGGSGAIGSVSGTPTGLTDSGVWTVDSDGLGGLQATFRPDHGGASITYTGQIAAGGTNDTLIPGLVLTANGVLTQGTDVIRVQATERGIGRSLHAYVDSLARNGGVMTARAQEMQARIKTINDQIDSLERRADAREELLLRRFQQMELTIQRLQAQQQALAQMQQQLANLAPRRPGS